MKFSSEDLKGRDLLGNLGEDGPIKMIFKEIGCMGVTGLIGVKIGSSNELL
jgi:hypothetical protein